MGGPGDYVDGCGVQGEIEYFCPGGAGFAPDEDFSVVGGGGEDVAIFWVRPRYGPDCSFVSVWILLVRGGGQGDRKGRRGTTHPLSVSVNRWDSPSTSKILIVRSEEQVARRRP